jgi:hypothetical protein
VDGEDLKKWTGAFKKEKDQHSNEKTKILQEDYPG